MHKMEDFMNNFLFDGLTFDDVSMVVQYSDVLPSDVSLETQLSSKIRIRQPFISAAMDTVTEWKMAVEMARNGCFGIIHKNMGIKEQAQNVRRVKKYLNGYIEKPVFVYEDITVCEVYNIKKKNDYNFSSFPVINRETGMLSGIITSHDMKFVTDSNTKVKDIMSVNLICGDIHTDFKKAYDIMMKNRIGKLPVKNEEGKLLGLFSLKDIKDIVEENKNIMNVDKKHRLICGAAISPYDYERVESLIHEKVDVLVVDTAHGHTKGVMNTVKELKNKYPDIDIIAGNIATAQAALDLYECGADAVKVGIGPGSICTTRVVAGVGVPQISAIYNCARALKDKIPVIADGGIRYSGDAAKAIAAGASTVMMGSVLAGTEQSPGEKILYNGRKFVLYRGMGSLAAMEEGEGSRKRYFQDTTESRKLVPEGIEGMVPYSGNVEDVVYQFCGGLRSSMGYSGAQNIKMFQDKATFVKVTPAGLKEAHPHDVTITKEAPNYKK